MNTPRFTKVLRRLEKFTKPGTNNRDFPRFVNYINGFLKHFGQERAYIVGSTIENLKLKWSKEGGDADFLILSGKCSVSVADVELREDFPCYLWVNVDKTKVEMNIELIDGRYLPADILRSVSPELFTCLRGVYLIFTGNMSNTPKKAQETTIGLVSKVGLAVTTYKDLKIDGQKHKEQNRHSYKRHSLRHENLKKYINQRRENSKYFMQDVDSIERAIQFISSIKIPGSSGSYLGKFQYFAFVSEKVTDRFRKFKEIKIEKDAWPLEDSVCVDASSKETPALYHNDLDFTEDDHEQSYEQTEGRTMTGKIRATFIEKYHLDFVPAIRLIGVLPCMDEWKQREHRWLIKEEIEIISNLDVFIVARYAPVNPSRKDFCLSFTLAENKLAECMSQLRRQVYLALKACLKGYITEFHKKHDREVKLTTYHLKTIIYRVSDITDPQMWIENNICLCFMRVLEYLEKTLLERTLFHYFIPSNLYANFDSSDFDSLLQCTRNMQTDPIEAIEVFFSLEDGARNETWFSEEEAKEIQDVIDNGGLEEEVDRMEEAILDILRGLHDGPRDSQGNSPFLEALKSSLQLFLKDEAMDNFRESGLAANLPPVIDSLLPHVLPSLTAALGGAEANPSNLSLIDSLENVLDTSSNEEEKQRAFEKLKYQVVSYFSR